MDCNRGRVIRIEIAIDSQSISRYVAVYRRPVSDNQSRCKTKLLPLFCTKAVRMIVACASRAAWRIQPSRPVSASYS